MSSRTKIWFAIAVSVIIAILLVWFLPLSDRNLINITGLIGFILSMLGIVISYIQILSVKKITLDTQIQISESLRRHTTILMISDLSKKGEIILEIQGYLREDKFDLCRLRMNDLKSVLSNIANQENYYSLIPRKEFKSALENFHLDYRNLLSYNPADRHRIDKVLVMEHLEALSVIFLNVESQLKK